MYPGIMIADIRHLKEILIEACGLHCLPEQRFVSPWSAGRHNDPVQPLFPDLLLHNSLGILRTGKQISCYKNHVRK